MHIYIYIYIYIFATYPVFSGAFENERVGRCRSSTLSVPRTLSSGTWSVNIPRTCAMASTKHCDWFVVEMSKHVAISIYINHWSIILHLWYLDILGLEGLEDQVLWSPAGRHGRQLQTMVDIFVKGATPPCLIRTAHVQVGPATSLQLRWQPSENVVYLFLFSELQCAWLQRFAKRFSRFSPCRKGLALFLGQFFEAYGQCTLRLGIRKWASCFLQRDLLTLVCWNSCTPSARISATSGLRDAIDARSPKLKLNFSRFGGILVGVYNAAVKNKHLGVYNDSWVSARVCWRSHRKTYRYIQ